jgi:hypothetical protein
MNTKFLPHNIKGRDLFECRRKSTDNIKRNLKEVGCNDMDWVQSTQNKVQWQETIVKTVPAYVNGGEFLDQLREYQHFREWPCFME